MIVQEGRRSRRREYLDMYSALSRAQALIFTAGSEAELLDRLCELAVGMDGISAIAIVLREANGRRSQLVAGRDLASHRVHAPVWLTTPNEADSNSCLWLNQLIGAERTVIIGKVAVEELEHCPILLEQLPDIGRAMAWVGIPVWRLGVLYGAMIFASPHPKFFSKKVVGLLEALERGLSFALDRFVQVRARAKADESMLMAATVFQSSAQGIAVTDATGKIVAVNSALEQLVGKQQSELVGRLIPDLMHSGFDEGRSVWQELLYAERWQGELSLRRPDGGNVAVWLTQSIARDAEGTIRQRIFMYSDLSERKAAVERIEYLAGHDLLTGLPNRVLLKQRVSGELQYAAENHQSLALLFIGLDRFKTVNDSLGHAVGDELLKQAAVRLTQGRRSGDTVARVGGDEFVLCLPRTGNAGAGSIAESIHQRFSEVFHVFGQPLRSAVSIGIAIYPEDGSNVEELIRNADTAMHAAKSAGRNTLRFYAADMNRDARARLELESELRVALIQDELRLYFQPQYDLTAGKLTGWEALVRWPHRERGMVMPGQFIEVAENSGLIVELGEWTIRCACRQQREWLDAGLSPVPISINLSARQFLQPQLPETLAQMLDCYQISPHLLRLEITEGVLMHGAQQTIELCERLRRMGIGLSIDDFGTGYSSLNYLRRFPIEELKIDQSFTRDLGRDRHADAIVQTIIALAKNLEIMVIAEGVETAEQADILRRMGCETGQGFLYSAALPGLRAAEVMGQHGMDDGRQAERRPPA